MDEQGKGVIFFFLLVAFFSLDVLYWYGDKKNVEYITSNSILWFFSSLLGFILLLVIATKKVSFSKARKIVFSFLCTLGIIINAVLVFLWYILKDFGF